MTNWQRHESWLDSNWACHWIFCQWKEVVSKLSCQNFNSNVWRIICLNIKKLIPYENYKWKHKTDQNQFICDFTFIVNNYVKNSWLKNIFPFIRWSKLRKLFFFILLLVSFFFFFVLFFSCFFFVNPFKANFFFKNFKLM